ncbi:Aspartyl/glutamyl-tRNA(Asn/Gln)amidotransferase subunit B [Metamycoplasma alkalescens 14918]|uniref:Aspartyl/glutamyl-tRNA(Asn/Gln) amidotransferase subunit B n=1 Tax=Metamycoplasma alkalescens 14918 TaxID=1188234 RepID=N9U9Z6_9BACT|nr:Asp-tRNA(Asn)/Glu-tRNA(Gln) amidotransferase subunit GatB [Metamycoplasma alkalescens]ENY53738.1 Aspartyl/glutamyl-tRNA(Asn/Gln)amidotransferase subunit B [Metamycoplasma alkalescens 14918]
MNSDWELVIGIEIHIELNTKTKMFSSQPNLYSDTPNIYVSPIDLAYPGTLPIVNKQAVIKAIKLAKALNMEIDHLIRFDRKNYFYPDLTKGYQITQQFNPIGKNGSVKIKVDNDWKTIEIERIHLEEDTAKSLHEKDLTFLNYNRSGVPLIEIVSSPVLHSAKEAVAYVEAIRQTVLAFDISDAKMNEGSLRVDVNISTRKKGTKDLNTRIEIKNLNSISNIEKAIKYEFDYQVDCYEKNQEFEQSTKRFDESKNITILMRSKSDAIDYKYFPDPNIPYIKLNDELINSIEIEELPYEKEKRYLDKGLNSVQISQLINNLEYANFLDHLHTTDFKKTANIFFSEIVSYLNQNNFSNQKIPFDVNQISELMQWVIDEKINKNDIKKILLISKQNPNLSFEEIAKKNHLFLEKKEILLEEIVAQILVENPTLETEFKNNFNRASKFLVGQVMKKTAGKANVIELNELIKVRYEKEKK